MPVLFSSHQLDLVDRLCDSIVVLHRGRVVAQGTSEDLRANTPLRYRLVTSGETAWVAQRPGIEVLGRDGEGMILAPVDEHAAERLLVEAAERGGVKEFARLRPSLSEIYREVTES
ncbi:DUF4162 domain-containing protein [Mobilicoccus caccae]|uniref:Daunorubicin resistance ATP-binding protein DrrA1/2-like C-terminal domain-containing protein n=1 Tax=Mobilicoccus caccae TaxID=1859295 RepID=A0ABQ6IYA1_9MICO|nr:hypothetical protein GCM10025883_37030 [Mobilicoccus caccae]